MLQFEQLHLARARGSTMQIEGRTFLVTGASSGIGAALAPMLAAQGAAAVGVVARRADRLGETLEACRSHAPASRMWVADLSDPDRAAGIAAEAWDELGGIDCLVNNAAMPKRKLVADHGADELDLVLRTNFVSPVRMALALLPRMLARGSGAVVNVGSTGGRVGIAHESAYCASKFALSGWSEAAAMDLVDSPVEVRLIQPGAIDTDIWDTAPGDLPGLRPPNTTSAEACAAGIVDALRGEAFETFVPETIRAVVDRHDADVAAWIRIMGEVGRQHLPATLAPAG